VDQSVLKDLRYHLKVRPIALRWMGAVLIALVITLQGQLSFVAWRQHRINTWCVSLPLDMSAEADRVFETTFQPVSRWGNRIILSMQGPARDDYKKYTQYTELEQTSEIRRALSVETFALSWRVSVADQDVETGVFSLSDITACIYPDSGTAIYRAGKGFNLYSKFSPLRIYRLQVTVTTSAEQLNQFSPTMQIQTQKTYKPIVPAVFALPGSLLGLIIGITLLVFGMRWKDQTEHV
jgi:hypothetical protein